MSSTPNPTAPLSAIGLSAADLRKYSLVRMIDEASRSGGKLPHDGLEMEASRAVAKAIGRQPQGFYLPPEVVNESILAQRQLNRLAEENLTRALAKLLLQENRALSAGAANAGGYLVGTDVLGSSMIELLRARTVVARLGATELNDLVGNVAIPRVTGGATAYWLAEGESVPGSDQAVGQLALTPHRLAGQTAYTKQLVAQTNDTVEAFVRGDLMATLAVERDRAAIAGSGVSGEPIGVLELTGINSVTFGAAPTWAKVVEFETKVAEDNADVGSMAFITTPATRGKWKTTVKVSGQAKFLCEDNRANGYPVEVTTNVPGDRVIFGVWSQLQLAMWAGLDVVINPYSLDSEGQVRVTVTMHGDNGFRHPVAFCASTDSGAQ